MTDTIGFIGLGQLGLPMATNLLDSGYALTVYNRTASKAEPLAKRGARVAAAAVDAVPQGGIVVTVLWDAAAVESVVTSDGFLERLGPSGIHVSMCTCLPEAARRLAHLHARHGSTYVEAPVFGRPEAAAARQLWMPLAGPKAEKDRVRPILEAMGAQGVFDFGEEIGAGTMVKIVGNFLLISATRSLAEALALIGKTGGDMTAVVEMLTQTLFPSPIYKSYGKLIAEGGSPMLNSGIPQKDLGLFEAIAQKQGLPAPLAHTILALVQQSTANS